MRRRHDRCSCTPPTWPMPILLLYYYFGLERLFLLASAVAQEITTTRTTVWSAGRRRRRRRHRRWKEERETNRPRRRPDGIRAGRSAVTTAPFFTYVRAPSSLSLVRVAAVRQCIVIFFFYCPSVAVGGCLRRARASPRLVHHHPPRWPRQSRTVSTPTVSATANNTCINISVILNNPFKSLF